jgi:hypothetical protein
VELKDIINEKIAELQRQRNEIVEAEYEKLKEEFMRLDWLRKTPLYFADTGSFIAVGITEFKLSGYNELAGKVCKDLGKFITLFGNNKWYQQNITIRKPGFGDAEGSNFIIGTDNAKLLTEFIEQYGLKIASSYAKEYAILSDLYKTLSNHGVY